MDIIEATALIGIKPPFTPEALRKSYRGASFVHHPDHGGLVR